MVVGFCFLGCAEADCKLEEMVEEEEEVVVVRDEGLVELGFGHEVVEGEVAAGVGLVVKTEPDGGIGERTGCTENLILWGDLVLAGKGEGDAVWVEVCFGIGLVVGPLFELGTEGWSKGVGLLDLVEDGTGVTGMGEGVRVRVWVGVTGVRVCGGVWAWGEIRARVV